MIRETSPATRIASPIDLESGYNIALPLGDQEPPVFWKTVAGKKIAERIKGMRRDRGIRGIVDFRTDLADVSIEQGDVVDPPKPKGAKGKIEPGTPRVRPTPQPKRVIKSVAGNRTAHMQPAPRAGAKARAGELSDSMDFQEYLEAKGWAELKDVALEAKLAGGSNGPATGASAALNKYWTRGAGLAKWADTPTPYRSLVAALKKEGVPGHMVNGLAAKYYKIVKGSWPGKHSKG